MDAPFIDDSMADSGTALNILRQKYPGMFGTGEAPPNPMFNSGPAVASQQAQVDPSSIPAPDVGQPVNKFNLPWLPGYKSPQPQRPPISTPTGQWAPGTNKAQKLEVVLRNGLQGAIAGYAADANAVVQSGGRRSGGFGLGVGAGFEAPAQQTQIQQTLQRGSLENQALQNQVTYAPQKYALDFGKTMSDIQKNLAGAGKASAEAGGVQYKNILDQAQALAARYKEDPGSGQLIDLQSGKPFGNSSALAPLTAEEAQVLGKEEADRVPLRLKNVASEIAARGLTTVNTEEGVFERNRITGTNTRLGNNPREISLDTPVGALDNTTGKQVMVTRKDIIANPGRYAPVSADVSTPVIKQTLKEYASTKPNTAGGTIIANNTAIAHLGLLNLAKVLTDGEQVVVGVPGVTGDVAGGPAAGGSPDPSAPVSLNSATLDQLESLPGVGPATAQKIVDYRTANGPFQSIDQLQDISGIGPAKYAAIAPKVML